MPCKFTVECTSERIFTRDSIYAIARICHANSVRQSVRLSHACIVSQESCAIAKMTAQCAIYGCPENFL